MQTQRLLYRVYGFLNRVALKLRQTRHRINSARASHAFKRNYGLRRQERQKLVPTTALRRNHIHRLHDLIVRQLAPGLQLTNHAQHRCIIVRTVHLVQHRTSRPLVLNLTALSHKPVANGHRTKVKTLRITDHVNRYRALGRRVLRPPSRRLLVSCNLFFLKRNLRRHHVKRTRLLRRHHVKSAGKRRHTRPRIVRGPRTGVPVRHSLCVLVISRLIRRVNLVVVLLRRRVVRLGLRHIRVVLLFLPRGQRVVVRQTLLLKCVELLLLLPQIRLVRRRQIRRLSRIGNSAKCKRLHRHNKFWTFHRTPAEETSKTILITNNTLAQGLLTPPPPGRPSAN